MRYLLLLLFIPLLTSCDDFFQQELDDPELDFDRKLVLFALLTPNDTLQYVDVRASIPAFGPRPDGPSFRRQLQDATVVLDDGTNQFELAYENGDGFEGYRIPHERVDITPGRTYVITATHEGTTAVGTTTVPTDSLRFSDLTVDIETEQQGSFRERKLFLTAPNLPANEEEYYLIYHDRISNNGRTQRELVDYVRGRDDLGDRLRFAPVFLIDGVRNAVSICVTDRPTFTYLTTRDVAFATQDNPFAEPAEVATNVEGGLGLVGGANCRRFVVN